MPCVNGSKLSPAVRREVLSAYGYRWTVENERRARNWYASMGLKPPTIPLISDSQWLAEHAFHITKFSNLDQRYTFAEPACMADDWTPEEQAAVCEEPVSNAL